MRSGAFSIAEPRSSTNGVLTGAGRASRCRIQALSTAAGCAAAGSVAAASSSPARTCVGRRTRRRLPSGLAFRRCGRQGVGILLASAVLTVAPEIIEVEPVERRIAQVMFEASDVTVDERGDGGRALAARDRDAVAEGLEHEIVAVAAAVQAEREL